MNGTIMRDTYISNKLLMGLFFKIQLTKRVLIYWRTIFQRFSLKV